MFGRVEKMTVEVGERAEMEDAQIAEDGTVEEARCVDRLGNEGENR